MMRRWLLRIGWAVAFVLALGPWYAPQPGTASASPSLVTRLLGPFARPAARVQLVRIDAAIRAGRTDIAVSRAEAAFALDPRVTEVWELLAHHLVFDRGNQDREPDAARRLEWLRAGLDVARRGEGVAAAPEQLAEWQGLVLAQCAQTDPDVGWPDGARGLWLAAAEAFDRATAFGAKSSEKLAEVARLKAAQLGR